MPLQEELEKQGVWLFRYRGTLPLVILGIGGLLYFRTEMNPETFLLEDTQYELITGNFWFVIAFCLLYWLYYERIMFAEEQFLRKKFGNSYITWAENVPAFIPNFSQFKKPDVPFNLKKVLKKEKNGLAAIFLIFCAFDIAGQFITHQKNYNSFLIVACALTFLFYFLIKFLTKQTTLLNETTSQQ